jgi:hypothetical protein
MSVSRKSLFISSRVFEILLSSRFLPYIVMTSLKAAYLNSMLVLGRSAIDQNLLSGRSTCLKVSIRCHSEYKVGISRS